MSYKMRSIAEFCKTGSGGTPLRNESMYYEGGTIPWVKSGELRENIIFNTEEYVTDLAVQETSVKLVPKGAILLAMYGATVGRMAVLGINATTNQAICYIIPDEKIANRDYLYRCLQSKVPEMLSQAIGGAQPNINQQIVRRLEIPLPPLAEQQRIAAILDCADTLRAKRRAALAKLDALLQATFLDMFGDPVTNPRGWEVGTIDLVVRERSDVRCGPFGTQLKVHELVDEGIPLFGIENVHNNKFIPNTDKFLTLEKAKQLKGFDVKNNDVLVTRMGTIGRACVVTGLKEEARFSYHLFRVRPDKERCLPKFLSSVICRSGTFQEQLRQLSHGAIMAGLNTSNLREVKFLLPPIEQQQQYVDLVEHVEKQKKQSQASLMQLDNLFHALQQRAFSGKL